MAFLRGAMISCPAALRQSCDPSSIRLNVWNSVSGSVPNDQIAKIEGVDVPLSMDAKTGGAPIAAKSPYVVARCAVGPSSRLRLSAQLMTPT